MPGMVRHIRCGAGPFRRRHPDQPGGIDQHHAHGEERKDKQGEQAAEEEDGHRPGQAGRKTGNDNREEDGCDQAGHTRPRPAVTPVQQPPDFAYLRIDRIIRSHIRNRNAAGNNP